MIDITSSHRALLYEHGYLVLPRFLDETELTSWRDAIPPAGEVRYGRLPLHTCAFPYDPQFEQIFQQYTNIWQTSKAVADILLGCNIGQVISKLLGAPVIRVWRDQQLTKYPGAIETDWHRDGELWSFDGLALSMWVALDDVPEAAGCMKYVGGSHRNSSPIGSPVMAPVAAGGACFHFPTTVHGALPNTTTSERHAMACAYMADGVTFNGRPNVLPPDLLRALNVGDVLDDPLQNPVIWPPELRQVAQ